MRGTTKISVILAHPRKGSFNHAICGNGGIGIPRGRKNTDTLHDLYAEQFDPLLPDPEIFRDATLLRLSQCIAGRSLQPMELL